MSDARTLGDPPIDLSGSGPGAGADTGRDLLYERPQWPVRPFSFDESVARVFPDMIRRSVPGYGETVRLIGLVARRFARPGTRCYDLGCSLGAATLAILGQTPASVGLVAVDSSQAMIDGLLQRLGSRADAHRVNAVCADVREVPIMDASVAVLCLTLQFVEPADRTGLLARIRSGLVPGGALILVEKTRVPEGPEGRLLTDLHEDFKRAQGYSELAIAGKRTALERVLVPDSPETHERRLAEAGFAGWTRWHQALGFVAWVAWT
jgi:tRNA (cmo5U34)-methyltransferase